MKKFDKLLSLLLSLTLIGGAAATTAMAVNVNPNDLPQETVSVQLREPNNNSEDPNINDSEVTDSSSSEGSEPPDSEPSTPISSSSTPSSIPSSEVSSSEPPPSSSDLPPSSETPSSEEPIPSSSEEYSEDPEPSYVDSSDDYEDPGNNVTPPDDLLPNGNDSRVINSNQDWNQLLSGIDSSNLDAIVSGASNVVFSKPSAKGDSSTKGAGGDWIFWLGIGLIAVALIGIGLIVYFQFFSKSGRIQEEPDENQEDFAEGAASEIIGVDEEEAPDDNSADYGDDYNYYDEEEDDKPEQSDLPDIDLDNHSAEDTHKRQPSEEDDDFWDKFFNK